MMRSKLDGIADVHAWHTTRDTTHALLPNVRTKRQKPANLWLPVSLCLRRPPAVKHPVMQAMTSSDCQAGLCDVARHGQAVEQTLHLPCTVGSRLNLNCIVVNNTWLSSASPDLLYTEGSEGRQGLRGIARCPRPPRADFSDL